ncbi:MAG: Beta-galactosidase C-terminal domain, partial [Lachnospiraceae bacterium]|nr:Beta-galactosidase C-terminal domain [Lachnospiraceae bacterium]
ATVRENENGNFLFLLNHRGNTVNVILESDGEDLLTGKEYQAGDRVTLDKAGVVILKRRLS